MPHDRRNMLVITKETGCENKAKLRERHNFSSSSINTLLIKLPVTEGLSIVIHFYGRKWNYNCRQTTLSESTT